MNLREVFIDIVQDLRSSRFESIHELSNSNSLAKRDRIPANEDSKLSSSSLTHSTSLVNNAADFGADGQLHRRQQFTATGLSNSQTPTNEIIVNGYRASLKDIATPFIGINDNTGASGSRAYAAPFDSVVAIANGSGRFCTGTLIAPDLVLSARHCEISSSDQVVFGDDAENADFVVGIQSVNLPGGSGGEYFDGNDIALLRLANDVPQSVAEPIRLTSASTSAVGGVASIFGYGNNGTGSAGDNNTSDGFRWGGQNVIDLYGDFSNGENLFLADFDDGVNEFTNSLSSIGSVLSPLQLEAIISVGDSGGPLLVEVDGELAIAGVASGGLLVNSRYASVGFWTGVGRFEQVISNAGGSFVGATSPPSGGDGDFPANDDHADETSPNATALEFELDGARLTGRDTGFLGFGETFVERDFFRFETSVTGRIIVDAKSLTSELDTVVRIYDANGSLLSENDNAASPVTNNPGDSQLKLLNMPAGEYFVSVGSADGSNGAYRLAVRSNEVVSSSDNSFGNATRIFMSDSSTTFINASISTANDKDFYQFAANVTGRLIVRSKALSGNLNTVLRGYDENREVLDANNNFRGSLDSKIDFSVIQGRDYFLNLNSVGASNGQYRISLRNIPVGDGGDGLPFANLNLESPITNQASNPDDLSTLTSLNRRDGFDMGLVTTNL